MPFEDGHKKTGGIKKGYKYDYTLSALKDSLDKDANKHDGENILDYYIRMARKDNRVLIALMKKLLPDLKQVEAIIQSNDLWATMTPADVCKDMDKLTTGDTPDNNT